MKGLFEEKSKMQYENHNSEKNKYEIYKIKNELIYRNYTENERLKNVKLFMNNYCFFENKRKKKKPKDEEWNNNRNIEGTITRDNTRFDPFVNHIKQEKYKEESHFKYCTDINEKYDEEKQNEINTEEENNDDDNTFEEFDKPINLFQYNNHDEDATNGYTSSKETEYEETCVCFQLVLLEKINKNTKEVTFELNYLEFLNFFRHLNSCKVIGLIPFKKTCSEEESDSILMTFINMFLSKNDPLLEINDLTKKHLKNKHLLERKNTIVEGGTQIHYYYGFVLLEKLNYIISNDIPIYDEHGNRILYSCLTNLDSLYGLHHTTNSNTIPFVSRIASFSSDGKDMSGSFDADLEFSLNVHLLCSYNFFYFKTKNILFITTECYSSTPENFNKGGNFGLKPYSFTNKKKKQIIDWEDCFLQFLYKSNQYYYELVNQLSVPANKSMNNTRNKEGDGKEEEEEKRTESYKTNDKKNQSICLDDTHTCTTYKINHRDHWNPREHTNETNNSNISTEDNTTDVLINSYNKLFQSYQETCNSYYSGIIWKKSPPIYSNTTDVISQKNYFKNYYIEQTKSNEYGTINEQELKLHRKLTFYKMFTFLVNICDCIFYIQKSKVSYYSTIDSFFENFLNFLDKYQKYLMMKNDPPELHFVFLDEETDRPINKYCKYDNKVIVERKEEHNEPRIMSITKVNTKFKQETILKTQETDMKEKFEFKKIMEKYEFPNGYDSDGFLYRDKSWESKEGNDNESEGEIFYNEECEQILLNYAFHKYDIVEKECISTIESFIKKNIEDVLKNNNLFKIKINIISIISSFEPPEKGLFEIDTNVKNTRLEHFPFFKYNLCKYQKNRKQKKQTLMKCCFSNGKSHKCKQCQRNNNNNNNSGSNKSLYANLFNHIYYDDTYDVSNFNFIHPTFSAELCKQKIAMILSEDAQKTKSNSCNSPCEESQKESINEKEKIGDENNHKEKTLIVSEMIEHNVHSEKKKLHKTQEESSKDSLESKKNEISKKTWDSFFYEWIVKAAQVNHKLHEQIKCISLYDIYKRMNFSLDPQIYTDGNRNKKTEEAEGIDERTNIDKEMNQDTTTFASGTASLGEKKIPNSVISPDNNNNNNTCELGKEEKENKEIKYNSPVYETIIFTLNENNLVLHEHEQKFGTNSKTNQNKNKNKMKSCYVYSKMQNAGIEVGELSKPWNSLLSIEKDLENYFGNYNSEREMSVEELGSIKRYEKSNHFFHWKQDGTTWKDKLAASSASNTHRGIMLRTKIAETILFVLNKVYLSFPENKRIDKVMPYLLYIIEICFIDLLNKGVNILSEKDSILRMFQNSLSSLSQVMDQTGHIWTSWSVPSSFTLHKTDCLKTAWFLLLLGEELMKNRRNKNYMNQLEEYRQFSEMRRNSICNDIYEEEREDVNEFEQTKIKGNYENIVDKNEMGSFSIEINPQYQENLKRIKRKSDRIFEHLSTFLMPVKNSNEDAGKTKGEKVQTNKRENRGKKCYEMYQRFIHQPIRNHLDTILMLPNGFSFYLCKDDTCEIIKKKSSFLFENFVKGMDCLQKYQMKGNANAYLYFNLEYECYYGCRYFKYFSFPAYVPTSSISHGKKGTDMFVQSGEESSKREEYEIDKEIYFEEKNTDPVVFVKTKMNMIQFIGHSISFDWAPCFDYCILHKKELRSKENEDMPLEIERYNVQMTRIWLYSPVIKTLTMQPIVCIPIPWSQLVKMKNKLENNEYFEFEKFSLLDEPLIFLELTLSPIIIPKSTLVVLTFPLFFFVCTTKLLKSVNHFISECTNYDSPNVEEHTRKDINEMKMKTNRVSLYLDLFHESDEESENDHSFKDLSKMAKEQESLNNSNSGNNKKETTQIKFPTITQKYIALPYMQLYKDIQLLKNYRVIPKFINIDM